MGFKFEKLQVWQDALDYADAVYDMTKRLPADERYNLSSQIRRAATSVGLNIAEGSTGLSDKEQVRFLNIANRSLIETVACIHLIQRRNYVPDAILRDLWNRANKLSRRIQSFKNALTSQSTVKETQEVYAVDDPPPF